MISLGKGNSIQKRIGSDNKKKDVYWKMNRKIESQVEEKLEGYLGLDEMKFMFERFVITLADHQYIGKCFHRRIVIFGEITIRGDYLE